jgi:PAS domain S-box-containing protein
VILVDPAGRIAFANEAAGRLHGQAGRPLVGAALSTSLFGEGEGEALAAVVDQVLHGQEWRGRLNVRRADGSEYLAEVTCLPIGADQTQGLIWILDTSAVEQQGSLRESHLLGDRLARLARVTTDLVMADTVEAVTKIVVSHGADAVGATIASMTLRDGEDRLKLMALRGGLEGEEQRWASYPLTASTPTSEAVRTGERVILVGAAAIAERYPHLEGVDRGERSIICLPLRVGTRTIGAIGLSFPGKRTLDAAELEFFDVLADTCAQALERITAQAVAAKQSAKLVFLADASTELASSLDYQATLSNVARLAVPTFADWCAIDLVVDGRLHRLAVEHVDPAKVQLAKDLEERYPSDPDAPNGAWNVMRTGQSELIHEITDEMLRAGVVDEEQLQIALDLQLRSALTVPLVARGRVLGVITWVSAESERLYSADDLALAEDLAKRAAIAIDNAELHSETLAAAVQLQHAVLPESLPVLPGWQIASYYSPSGRTDVGGDFYDAVPLSHGRLAIFVGDVMGRGVTAAAAMAQMRSAVRAYIAVDPAPEAVMANLDLMFARYPTEQLVTLVYLLLDPARDELAVANAGHPPPVLLRADLGTEQLPLATGCPLGVQPANRTQASVPFHAGDTVLAFTDGLIERRDEDIDKGQDRVLKALASLAEPDLSAALDAIVTRLRDPSRDDDVAALAVRRTT